MINRYFVLQLPRHLISYKHKTVFLLKKDMEKDLDRYCNNIMSALRKQVPRIKGENLKIISLFFAGFSYETIQFILRKNSTQSLRTARSRFRKEIIEAEAPDA